MIRKVKDGIVWLEFEHLANCSELSHAIFLRHGGMSQGPYTSFNFNVDSEDHAVHREVHFDKVKQILKLDNLCLAKQIHGNAVVLVDNKSKPVCDALATQQSNLGLLIQHADCQAAIFYDPLTKSLANVHSGWRGSVQNIYKSTIDFMQQHFNSKPENILIGISPSLGPSNAEFIHYRTELPPSFWEFQVRPNHFDFWAISEMQLTQAGILPHHIECARICTYANPEDYYSYRRCKTRGGHATVVGLKVK